MALHRPPTGENMITQHQSDENCPCKPIRMNIQKARTTGRAGRHQGYNTTVVYQHQPMPTHVAEVIYPLDQQVTGLNGGTRVRSVRTGLTYRVKRMHVTYIGLIQEASGMEMSVSREDLNEMFEKAEG